MAEYDLTQTIVPNLDRHLVFPLLAHLVENELFPVEQVQAAQYELAKGTNMVDYAVSLFEQLHPNEEVPSGVSSASILFSGLDRVQSFRESVRVLSTQMNGYSKKRRQS